ncbi:MAG: ABC transporter ATP-binding protein [Deltaproteobacteria bacterium]|nr:ABC transporter ATP-binding protein [Deltaproteobacteria bacterium]MBW1952195.1 ABC transporter ATP-binding protein [Deltaproteobacteria bacterium]MBW1985729.1 ABC transporter ATP-binding protein [Deltaproteobacteria bacterium]MBW2134642.1 ABC transporter ATP-binding protein [Deltaproteobacteria bacterium]
MGAQAVEIKNLYLRLNNLLILEDINLEIQAGRFVGVLGPNGAGKSSLIKVILGLVKPTRGEVRVFGDPPRKLRRTGHLVGYLPQRPLGNPHFPVSVMDVVLMGRYGHIGLLKWPSAADKEIARQNLKRVGIAHLADRPIGALSGGEQQRVFIARALAEEPRLLLLDEPTVSLDVCSQDELYDLINKVKLELNLTVILVSHDIGAVATHVDDIICINRRIHVHQPPPIGRIALENTFGCSVEFLFHGEIPHRVVRVHDG